MGDGGCKRGWGSGPVLTRCLGSQGKVRTEQIFGEGKKESTRKTSERGNVFQVEGEKEQRPLTLKKSQLASVGRER